MRITAIAAALALGVAGMAQATTYEFTTIHGPVHAVLGDGYFVTTWKDGAPDPGSMIGGRADGIGIAGPRDAAAPSGGEMLRVTFEEAVRLDRITLAAFGEGGAELWLDDVRAGALAPGEGSVFEVGRTVRSFLIGGVAPGAVGLRSFELEPAAIAPVPAPAAGSLLLAGLAGFCWLRRRR